MEVTFDWLAGPAGVQVIDLNGEVPFPQGGSQCIRITPGLQQGVIKWRGKCPDSVSIHS